MTRPLILTSILFTAIATLPAQVSQTLDLSTEAAVGSGDFTAHYLAANRHGILSPLANTGYMRASYQAESRRGDWTFSGGLDAQFSLNSQQSSPLYIQQLYAQVQWKFIDVRAGSREINALFRNQRLSSGSMVWSGNSRPIPGLYLGFHDFVDVPLTRHWVQFYIDGSYGYYMDSQYQEDEYARYIADKTGYGRSFLTTHVWSHQKRAALRTNPDQHLIFTFSCEHAVQFGGHSTNYIDPSLNGSFDPSFNDLFTVLLPLHGDDSANSGDQAFVYGNHIGSFSAMFEYQWGEGYQHKVDLYGEDPYEDGSGMRKGNGMDGLWGIEYHNRKPYSFIQGVVLEHLITTDQSGPIHWAPSDFDGQDIAQVAHSARGADNYYNNFFYTGYSQYGMACGSPMLKSPVYNRDHYLRFTDNRIKAWHLGIEGTLHHDEANECSVGYRLLASHRRSWGTYFEPSSTIRHDTSALVELIYHTRQWQCSATYAFDQGDLMGNNHTFGLRFNYHLSL